MAHLTNKKILFRAFIALAVFGYLFFAAHPAFAQSPITVDLKSPVRCGGVENPTLADCIKALGDAVRPIAELLLPVVIIIAGIVYMVSAGNEKRLTQARQTLTWAAVGYAVVLLARFVSDVVNYLVGGGPPKSVTHRISGILTRTADLLYSVGVWTLPLVVLYGVYMFITSGGEPEKLKKGKNLIMWGAIGFALLLLYQFVAPLVKSIVG